MLIEVVVRWPESGPTSDDIVRFGRAPAKTVNEPDEVSQLRNVSLVFSMAGSQDEEEIVGHARQLLPRLARIVERAKELAADQLLVIKNSDWLEESEAAVSRAVFVSRLSPSCIEIRRDGAFEILLDDSDLFWGHTIVVSMREDGQLSYLRLEGSAW